MKILFQLSLLLVLVPTLSPAQDKSLPESIWLGTIKTPAIELRLGIDISYDENGALKAVLTSIDQGGVKIPMDEAVYEGDTLDIKSAKLQMHIRGLVNLDEGSWTTLFKQGPALLPMIFHRVEALPALNRPQEPQPPFPYDAEDVYYENTESGTTIAATLTIPEGEGPFPAVLLISGSGAQNRDQEIMGHKTFAVLADHLSRKGIAVLRYDDRGTGESTGNFATASWSDFISDALCGIDFLMQVEKVDKNLIGIAGHSEGGTIAPLIANRSEDIDFMIMMAAAVLPWDQISLYQKKRAWISAGMLEEDIALNTAWHDSVTTILSSDLGRQEAEDRIIALYNTYSEDEVARMQKPPETLEFEIGVLLSPWWREACRTDVRPELRKVTIPVLAFNGEKDTQVEAASNLTAIQEDLEAAPTKWFSVGSLPGLNHLFQTAGSGEAFEYGQIEESFAPEALDLVSDWILGLQPAE